MRSLSLAELQAMSRSMFLYITFITYHFSLFTIHYSLAKRYEYRLGYLKMMDNNAVRPMTSG